MLVVHFVIQDETILARFLPSKYALHISGNPLPVLALDELLQSRRGGWTCMEHADRYAGRPLAFLLHYVSARPASHAVIIFSVLAAVGCSVGAQYGLKILVD